MQQCERWFARVKKDGATHYLGCFDTPEKAHKAYIQACKQLYGYIPADS